jgi:hypothetical protein
MDSAILLRTGPDSLGIHSTWQARAVIAHIGQRCRMAEWMPCFARRATHKQVIYMDTILA